MNSRTTRNTTIICGAAVLVVALITIPFELAPDGQAPAGGEQYRQLAEEYRRLADLAITEQEHTDIKLGDVSVQLDYLREQDDSLQKILKDVE